MYQVISNLLRNIVKFANGNQAKIEIILEKVKEDNKKINEYSVKIRDNDTGIDPEICRNYFQNLQSQNMQRLSLYISKKIIEACGGTTRG
jgi:signal transduction histidine kinase